MGGRVKGQAGDGRGQGVGEGAVTAGGCRQGQLTGVPVVKTGSGLINETEKAGVVSGTPNITVMSGNSETKSPSSSVTV